MKTLHGLCAAALLGLCSPSVTAQERPVALTNARILTQVKNDDGSAKVIENGTILLRGGEIVDVGDNLFLPPGTKTIDLKGGSVMPGLVHAWSQAGLNPTGDAASPVSVSRGRGRRRAGGGSRRGGGRMTNSAAETLTDQLYARQDIFSDLLEVGVTTLVIRPEGTGFPGYSARLDLGVEDESKFVLDDQVFVPILPQSTENGRKLLEKALSDANKLVEERNKPKPEPKPEEASAEEGGEKPAEGEAKEGEKPAEGETPPKPDEPKPEPKPEGGEGEKPAAEAEKPKRQRRQEKKVDPNLEVLADMLQGKRKGFLNLSSAAEMLHLQMALGELEISYPCVVVADRPNESEGSLMVVIEQLKALEPTVLIAPTLTSVPFQQTVLNPAKQLHDAGLEVGFVLSDSPRGVRDLWFALMELVRYGLPAEVALAGVTRVPAEALGLEAELGTVEAGKKANLLVFSGDPLDPTSRLQHVFYNGQRVGDASQEGSR